MTNKKYENQGSQTVNPEIFQLVANRNLPPVTTEMREQILRRCAESQNSHTQTQPDQSPSPANLPRLSRRPLSRVGLVALLLLLLTLGTVFALSMQGSFSQFFPPEQLEIVQPDLLYPAASVTKEKVTMTVDELLNTTRGYALTVSFVNEGSQPWPEGTYLSDLHSFIEGDDTFTGFARRSRQRVLSEDGRLLTYYLEQEGSHGLAGQTLSVNADDLLCAKPLRQFDVYHALATGADRSIPFAPVVETAVYAPILSEDFADYFRQLYQNHIRDANEIVDFELARFPYAGAVVSEENPDLDWYRELSSGLFVFFKTDDTIPLAPETYSSQLAEVHIINQTTGVTWGSRPFADFTDPDTGEQITVFRYYGIPAEEASEYAIYNIIWEQIDWVQEGSWQVSLDVEADNIGLLAEFSSELKVDDEVIPYYGELRVSPLGITIIGRPSVPTTLMNMASAGHYFLRVWDSADREIAYLKITNGSYDQDAGIFTMTYQPHDKDFNWGFLDIYRVSYITIGEEGQRVDLNK